MLHRIPIPPRPTDDQKQAQVRRLYGELQWTKDEIALSMGVTVEFINEALGIQ